MPLQAPDALGQARSLAARIRQSRANHAVGPSASIRDLIDEGRR